VRTILVVAAERLELRWIRSNDRDIRFVTAANGPGPKLAAEAVDGASERVDAVLSTGLCGALDVRLRVADVVVASSVNGKPVSIPARKSPCFEGALVSIDHVAATAVEKRELGANGAMAVEMEAAGVLERATALGVPFYCIRAVSDTAHDSFAVDFNAARRPDGRFDRGHIVRQALASPLVMIPELLRLRRNAARAVRALGDFVADCDF
jgi:hypothetical protein